MNHRLSTCLAAAVLVVVPFVVSAGPPNDQQAFSKPVVTHLRGLPPTEGRQLFSGDEEGNAYIIQLAEGKVFEIDETGSARFHLQLESEQPVGGALRAAVGAEGKSWVFGFAPHFVRVFRNGKEIPIERPNAFVTGMTITGGKPTLALDASRPVMGADLSQTTEGDTVPPLVVQLDGDGAWRTWILREETDYYQEGESTNLLAQEARLTGDPQGRLLMARHNRYEIREYNDTGKLVDHILEGAVEMVQRSPEATQRLEDAGVSFRRNGRLPKSVIEGIVWSPDVEILILTRGDEGNYALDRWLPTQQERHRLTVPELDGQRRIQMVAGHTGLMLLPHNSMRLVVLPWEYLRGAEWEPVEDETREVSDRPGPAKPTQ